MRGGGGGGGGRRERETPAQPLATTTRRRRSPRLLLVCRRVSPPGFRQFHAALDTNTCTGARAYTHRHHYHQQPPPHLPPGCGAHGWPAGGTHTALLTAAVRDSNLRPHTRHRDSACASNQHGCRLRWNPHPGGDGCPAAARARARQWQSMRSCIPGAAAAPGRACVPWPRELGAVGGLRRGRGLEGDVAAGRLWIGLGHPAVCPQSHVPSPALALGGDSLLVRARSSALRAGRDGWGRKGTQKRSGAVRRLGTGRVGRSLRLLLDARVVRGGGGGLGLGLGLGFTCCVRLSLRGQKAQPPAAPRQTWS